VGDRYGWAPELYGIMIDPDFFARWLFVDEMATLQERLSRIEIERHLATLRGE